MIEPGSATAPQKTDWKWLGLAAQGLIFFVALFLSGLLVGRILAQKRKYEEEIEAFERNEAAITASEERFRHLFEDSPDATLMLRPQGNVFIECNRAAVEMMGVASKADLIGRSPVEMSPPIQADGRLTKDAGPALVTQALQKGRLRFEWLHRRANGDIFPVEVSLTTITDGHEKLIHTVWRDITERKKWEALTEGKRKAAEEAAVAKSKFLSEMSHEIRNPMQGVIGLADLLSRGELNPGQREYLDNLKASANRVVVTLNEILSLSKIEAGKLDAETVGFKIDESLQVVENMFGAQAKTRKVELSVRRGPNVPLNLVGEKRHLEDVLINLTSNALKFTRGGGKVEVAADLVSEDENLVLLRFTVRDTGIGISSEERRSLFQPYSPSRSDVTHNHKGSGLGLSISKHLVGVMGGEIGMTPNPDVGSTFWFTAKFGRPGEAGKAVADSADGPSGTPLNPPESQRFAEHLAGSRVLLVEDDEINQMVAKDVLALAEIQVTVASNGQQAVDAVTEATRGRRAFDAVLMDCNMPVMDGYDATRILRNAHDARSLPIIAMTAYAMEQDWANCAAVGMNDHISKPFHGDSLLSLLSVWIRRDGPGHVDPQRTGQASPKVANSPFPGQDSLEKVGIDVADGLRRFVGNRELYLKLLRQFGQERADAVLDIRNYLAGGNEDMAGRGAHNLVSQTGNLGARKASALARALETAIVSGKSEETEELLAQLAGLLAEIVSAIRQLPAAPALPMTMEPPNLWGGDGAQSSGDLLESLANLLRRGQRLQARKVAEALKKQVGEADSAILENVLKSIERFDCQGALQQLAGLKL